MDDDASDDRTTAELETWHAYDAGGPMLDPKVRYRNDIELPQWQEGPDVFTALQEAESQGWRAYDREPGQAPGEYAIFRFCYSRVGRLSGDADTATRRVARPPPPSWAACWGGLAGGPPDGAGAMCPLSRNRTLGSAKARPELLDRRGVVAHHAPPKAPAPPTAVGVRLRAGGDGRRHHRLAAPSYQERAAGPQARIRRGGGGAV